MPQISSIQAQFLKNARGDAFIRFFDPEYVRADIIVFERSSKSLYAVLHEQEHFLGHVNDDMVDAFIASKEVHLSAPHYFSGNLHLRAPLSVTE
jgi:hypothetical protein